ncbi:hypothetical protein [Paenibacillus arenilitoris]|uniref:Uncharacterized protein n=1 Tax=Paenibacillus arenilitoris TaxID=2772299 RepID=A0A927CKP2_9BACL|nr:hypothetical protein [Paenibacillus arenilitoris]MBD2867951.1 hypothetical protein [Paenibacillus arenilitoris]
MGYCLACSLQEDKEDAMAESNGKNYDYKMFLRADAKAADHSVQPF